MDKLSFDFTKTEYLRICEEAMLSDLQKELLEDKIKGMTIVQMSMKHNVSTDVVSRNIRKIKNKILKMI